MGKFELDQGVRPVGGRPEEGGGFHLSFRSGSRSTGACAVNAHDYIAREGRFDNPDLDRAVYTESGNMPSWAEDDARGYWDAADLYERANGRLFVAGDFALPCGLDRDDQVELARSLVKDLTEDEHLPYTFAIHAGEDQDGREHNPHVHVMFSERRNDGIDRSREDWFRRANREHPEQGGATKSRSFHGHDWVERARERLATAINERLRECGREERVDHRSYERQGLDQTPGEHIGPGAAHMFGRTGENDRLEEALAVERSPRAIVELAERIEHLERMRADLLLEQYEIEHPHERPHGTSGNGRSRDSGPER
jgi:hypothetical protein